MNLNIGVFSRMFEIYERLGRPSGLAGFQGTQEKENRDG